MLTISVTFDEVDVGEATLNSEVLVKFVVDSTQWRCAYLSQESQDFETLAIDFEL